MLLWTGRTLGLRRWRLLALVLPVLLLYALLAGESSSIWRATIAGAAIAWALLEGRDVDGLSLWSAAFAGLLWLDPLQGSNLGFQLTFAATWGLFVLSPRFERGLEARFGPTGLGKLLAFSLGAQAATAPLLMHHFGRVSAAGLSAGMIAVPLSGALVGTGACQLLVPSFGALNYFLTRGMGQIAVVASHSPGAQVEGAGLKLGWTALLYVLLLLAAQPPERWLLSWHDILRGEARRWRKYKAQSGALRPQSWLVAAMMVLSLWAVWRTFGMQRAPLRVALLDVGQGECIVIQAPSGRTMMIDGGSLAAGGRGAVGKSVIVPYLNSLGVHRLDAIVLTHPDADHCNAIPDVLREIPVGMALDGGAQNHPNAAEQDYLRVKEELRARNVPIIAARGGQKLDLGDGIELTVLAPLEPPFEDDRASNNNGAVLRLDDGATSFLFCADIEAPAEERLVRRGLDLHCTVLKVAHHGSKSSSTSLFLDKVRPRAAMLSCGRYNSFGHPATQTLESLQKREVPVFRTDVSGQIEVLSDGRECRIQTFR